MKKILIIFVAAALIVSCRNEKPKETVEETNTKVDSLTYNYDSVVVYSKNIIKSENNQADTTKASVTYPVFENEQLNKYIQRKVTDYIAKEEQTASYDYIANSFVKGYDDYYAESKNLKEYWFLVIDINVLYQNKNYIALQYLHSDYSGGAHPNSAFSYINYDLKSNNPITLDSLIDKSNQPKLLSIAETIFRKNEKLTPTEPLTDKYFFDKGKFALAQNYYFDKDGLIFLYNPYEIKAYAYGTTKLVIPYSDLKEIAKPNTILTTN